MEAMNWSIVRTDQFGGYELEHGEDRHMEAMSWSMSVNIKSARPKHDKCLCFLITERKKEQHLGHQSINVLQKHIGPNGIRALRVTICVTCKGLLFEAAASSKWCSLVTQGVVGVDSYLELLILKKVLHFLDNISAETTVISHAGDTGQRQLHKTSNTSMASKKSCVGNKDCKTSDQQKGKEGRLGTRKGPSSTAQASSNRRTAEPVSRTAGGDVNFPDRDYSDIGQQTNKPSSTRARGDVNFPDRDSSDIGQQTNKPSSTRARGDVNFPDRDYSDIGQQTNKLASSRARGDVNFPDRDSSDIGQKIRKPAPTRPGGVVDFPDRDTSDIGQQIRKPAPTRPGGVVDFPDRDTSDIEPAPTRPGGIVDFPDRDTSDIGQQIYKPASTRAKGDVNFPDTDTSDIGQKIRKPVSRTPGGVVDFPDRNVTDIGQPTHKPGSKTAGGVVDFPDRDSTDIGQQTQKPKSTTAGRDVKTPDRDSSDIDKQLHELKVEEQIKSQFSHNATQKKYYQKYLLLFIMSVILLTAILILLCCGFILRGERSENQTPVKKKAVQHKYETQMHTSIGKGDGIYIDQDKRVVNTLSYFGPSDHSKCFSSCPAQNSENIKHTDKDPELPLASPCSQSARETKLHRPPSPTENIRVSNTSNPSSPGRTPKSVENDRPTNTLQPSSASPVSSKSPTSISRAKFSSQEKTCFPPCAMCALHENPELISTFFPGITYERTFSNGDSDTS
ncbi:uncharacterized protein LOC142490607 [Ascaphus truei]|uniref:uncharacterized protein LOC142490607 n=1 Tax=Ascaphus truei TaxID=8439 RepID=UPI003F5A7BAA